MGLATGDCHEPIFPPSAHPEGSGSVPRARHLPAPFDDTLTRYIDTGELRRHAVVGGDGPPLLLVFV